MDFLRDHLYETELAIQAGVGRFTWQSFNVIKYCENIQVLLRKLSSIVSQINYIRIDIRNRIDKIKHFDLFTLQMNSKKGVLFTKNGILQYICIHK